MKYNTLQNLHTHTTYCEGFDDGIDTLEEMILAAYHQGFGGIGLSPHSARKGVTIPKALIESYQSKVAELKIKYADKIDVFCGMECEKISHIDRAGFDYLLGAVHYLKCGDEFVVFDVSDIELVKEIIRKHFGGDGMAYAKAYYSQLAELSQHGTFDIIAHIDLIAKFCEKEQLFDVTSKEYQWTAIEAAEQLAGKIPYFEVNTGAVSRGFLTTPYPDRFLLRELKRLGFGAVITSDCHDSKYLSYGFEEAEELLKECGFKEQYVLTKNGFIPFEL